MKFQRIKVQITLSDPMLGTKPANPEIFSDYVASKRPDGPAKDELESAESTEINGTTGFHKLDGKPFILDYQIKGFLKEACSAMRQIPSALSANIASHKSRIDLLFFVEPRSIEIQIQDGQSIGICERPLRADTMQGPRVALARSEEVPAGSIIEFTVILASPTLTNKEKVKIASDDLLKEWLDYGQLHGLGQWRNSGKGRFIYKFIPE